MKGRFITLFTMVFCASFLPAQNNDLNKLDVLGDIPISHSDGAYGGPRMANGGNDLIVQFGGDTLRGTYEFVPSTNTWTETVPVSMHDSINAPEARMNNAIAYIGDGKVLMHGGSRTNKVGQGTYSDTWLYDTKTKQWTDLKPEGDVPWHKHMHAMAWLGGDQVLLIGGLWASNETWLFDLSENKWTNTNPTYYLTEFVYNADLAYAGTGKVVLAGAGLKSNSWFFDITTNEWTKYEMPISPGATSLAYIGDGGLGDGHDRVVALANDGVGSSLIFDVNTKTWTIDGGQSWMAPTSQCGISESNMDGSSPVVILSGNTSNENYMGTWAFGGGDYPMNNVINIPPPPFGTIKTAKLSDSFVANWDVTPNKDNLEGIFGLSNREVTSNAQSSKMGVIIRFNSAGFIEARNNTRYDAEKYLEYRAGKKYAIKVVGNLKTQKYSAFVTTEDGKEHLIADNYAFRTSTSQNQFNFLSVLMKDNSEDNIEVSFINKTNTNYSLRYLENLDIDEETESLKASFKVKSTSSFINASINISDEKMVIDSTDVLNSILRFKEDGKVDAVNGDDYESINDFTYSANVDYTVNFTVDVFNQKYSLSITQDDAESVEIASDYSLPSNISSITTIAKIIEARKYDYSELKNLIISNFNNDNNLNINNTIAVITHFDLEQNSPNPFKSSTRINYSISKDNNKLISHVTLEIYDLEGRLIATLVDSNKNAGSYSTVFDASFCKPGIYIYRLTCNGEIKIKKMMLIN